MTSRIISSQIATSQVDNMSEDTEPTQPSPFPYPVSKREHEAPALTWVRNHSSYMTVGGFLNSLQVAGVYVRGILLNLVVLAPLILLSAFLPARFHHSLLNVPFVATGIALVVFALALTVFLARGPIDLVNGITRRLSHDPKREGSVFRLGRERLMALAMLALGAGLLVDLTPRLIEFARLHHQLLELNWPNVSAGIIVMSAFAGSASRFLDLFKSQKVLLAVGLIGLVSLAIPYLMLLGVTNYLVYGVTPPRSMYAWLLLVNVIALLIATVVATRVSKTPQMPYANKKALVGIVVAFALGIGVLLFATSKTGDHARLVDSSINNIARPLGRLAAVNVPEDSPLAKSAPYIDFIQKANFFESIDNVHHSEEQSVGRAAESVSILSPATWLNWMSDRDINEERFHATTDFVEAGERLQQLDSISRSIYLDHATVDSYRTLRTIYNKRREDDSDPSEDYVQMMLEADAWVRASKKTSTQPNRNSTESPKHIEQEIERRRFASSLTIQQLVRILDVKDVIHRDIPNSTQSFNRVDLPDNATQARSVLIEKLNGGSTTIPAADISESVTELCKGLGFEGPAKFRNSCFSALVDEALYSDSQTGPASRIALAELFNPSINHQQRLDANWSGKATIFEPAGQLSDWAVTRIAQLQGTEGEIARPVVRTLVLGDYGNLDGLDQMNERVFAQAFPAKAWFIVVTAGLLSAVVFLFVDINRTSAHGFWRDRLSRAFLFDVDSKGRVSSAADVRLSELSNYDAGSVAPFHLINCAVNLQRSADLEIRADQSDYFTFNAIYSGSDRTGYAKTETIEDICPSLSVGTAMAISAGAASPNMGRYTSSLVVFLMTFANLRLGYWLPNPRQVIADLNDNDQANGARLLNLEQARKLEIERLVKRRANLATDIPPSADPTFDLQESLAGLACSGGGIRSASINIGIAQALHQAGIFTLFDYLSTVSGGGYFGSSVSAAMRATSSPTKDSKPVGSDPKDPKPYESGTDPWITGYRWIPRPTHYFKEMTSWLRDDDRWVNVSDGGHLENLGFYELLRRRCRFIVVGDGEADPNMDFPSLTHAIQTARIRLNTTIEWTSDSVHLWDDSKSSDDTPRPHHAVGMIRYPDDDQPAFVLYLKSSLNGDEPADVRGYSRLNKSFPHETTADQFFDPSQFEAYRVLGKHIAESALNAVGIPDVRDDEQSISLAELMVRLQTLLRAQEVSQNSNLPQY